MLYQQTNYKHFILGKDFLTYASHLPKTSQPPVRLNLVPVSQLCPMTKGLPELAEMIPWRSRPDHQAPSACEEPVLR